MLYLLFIPLIVLIAFLIGSIQKRNKEIQEIRQKAELIRQLSDELKQKAAELESAKAAAEQRVKELNTAQAENLEKLQKRDSMQAEITACIDTIHLYASLAEEEAASASVKEKLVEIIRSAEQAGTISQISSPFI